MKLRKREKVLIISFCTFILIYAYYSFLLKPAMQRAKMLETTLKEYKTVLKTKQKDRLDSSTFQQDLKILNKKIDDLSSAYFPDIIQEECMLVLDGIIKRSNIKIQNIAFNEPKVDTLESINSDENTVLNSAEEDTKTQVEKMDIVINAEGNYFNICDFINNVEQINKKVTITNIHLTRKDNSWLSASINLSFYSIPKLKNRNSDMADWQSDNKYGKGNPFD